MRTHVRIPTVLVFSLAFVSCRNEPLAPSIGKLEITTTTSGAESDPDGYTFRLDGGEPRAIGPMTISEPIELAPGEHTLLLEGLAPNCTVVGENPRGITLTAGRTTTIPLHVTCSATVGNLWVQTITSGQSLDPDGYTVKIDGIQSKPVGTNASVNIAASAGLHEVELSGIAANCVVEGEHPAHTTVAPGQSLPLKFAIRCTPVDKILFLSHQDGVTGIYTMNRDGTESRNLVRGGYEYKATWSPDGSRIAFTSDRAGDAHLFTMNADGTGETILSRVAWYTWPAWSPDGRKIAFLNQGRSNTDPAGSNRIGPQIFLTDPTGSAPIQLTYGPYVSSLSPLSWSPDGTRILFSPLYRGPIFVINAQGTNQVALTTTSSSERDTDPQWSPDGSKIAFIRQQFDTVGEGYISNLWVMEQDGSRPTRLTDFDLTESGWIEGYTWSPAGDWLVVSARGELYRMKPDGSSKISLHRRGVRPVWSPDGSRILFEHFGVGGPLDLLLMDPDGSNVVNLTNDPAQDVYGAWQPMR